MTTVPFTGVPLRGSWEEMTHYYGIPFAPVREPSVMPTACPIADGDALSAPGFEFESKEKINPNELLQEKVLVYLSQYFVRNRLFVTWLSPTVAVLRRREVDKPHYVQSPMDISTLVDTALAPHPSLRRCRNPGFISGVLSLAHLRKTLPTFNPHRDFISFTNCVVYLPNGAPVSDQAVEPWHPFTHIKHPYPSDLYCPQLVALAAHQRWSPATLYWFLVLIGSILHYARDTRVMWIPFLWGVPRSGKSVWMNIISGMIPPEKCFSLMESGANQFTFSELLKEGNVWAIFGQEVGKEHGLSRTTLTQVFGGDQFSSDQKYGSMLHGRNYAPVVLAGNSRPLNAIKSDEASQFQGALQRRMFAFPFMQRWTDAHGSSAEQDVLNGPELPRLMLAGTAAYAFAREHVRTRQGWSEPSGPASEQIKLATWSLMNDDEPDKAKQDTPPDFSGFIKSCVEIIANGHESHAVPVSDVMERYRHYCQRTRQPATMSVSRADKRWQDAMASLGCYHVRRVVGGERPWVFTSMVLHPVPQEPFVEQVQQKESVLERRLDMFRTEESPMPLDFLVPSGNLAAALIPLETAAPGGQAYTTSE